MKTDRKYYNYGRIINAKRGRFTDDVLWIRSFGKEEGYGDYRGYVKGDKVTLYPRDAYTETHFGKHAINIKDLRKKEDGGKAYER